jgi:mannosylglycerate hydrolase
MKLPINAQYPGNLVKFENKRSEIEREMTILVSYTLNKNSRSLDVKVEVDNNVEDHRLRVMFDTGIITDESNAAGHFTVDKRPVTPEIDEDGEYYPGMQTLPQQTFVDLNDGKTGFAVINNCMSEFEAMDNEQGTLALTLFRSVRNRICSSILWNRFPEQKGGQSLGLQEYEYSIVPHEGTWEEAGIYEKSQNFNTPLRMVQTSSHKGELPLETGFIAIDNKDLVVSAIKKSEDRDSIIIRVYNPTQEIAEGNLSFNSKIDEAYFTDLNEKRNASIRCIDGYNIPITAGCNKIVTVEIVIRKELSL